MRYRHDAQWRHQCAKPVVCLLAVDRYVIVSTYSHTGKIDISRMLRLKPPAFWKPVEPYLFDYGWRLAAFPGVDYNSRSHVSVTISY